MNEEKWEEEYKIRKKQNEIAEEIKNELSDDEIMDIELAEALERENATIIELELEKELEENKPSRPEPAKRKLRKRDLERQALSRMEDSARTEEDFQNVVTIWNRLDANRERKERYHEIGRSDVPLEWGMSPDEIGCIAAVYPDGTRKEIIKNGRFVLDGCEKLNEPFKASQTDL